MNLLSLSIPASCAHMYSVPLASTPWMMIDVPDESTRRFPSTWIGRGSFDAPIEPEVPSDRAVTQSAAARYDAIRVFLTPHKHRDRALRRPGQSD